MWLAFHFCWTVIFDSSVSHSFHRTDFVRLLYFPYLESKLILSTLLLCYELPKGP